MAVERITFSGAQGQELAAHFHDPAGPMHACALFAHCFACGDNAQAAVKIADALAERGIGTLRFDFTGLDEHEDNPARAGFTASVEAIVAAADWLREARLAPTILIGHSLGGAAMLSAAGRISEALAVATIGAPAHPASLSQLLVDEAEEIAEHGRAQVKLGERSFRVSKHFLEELAAQGARKTISKLGKALLVFHSPDDQLLSVDNAAALFSEARHPKSFVCLDGADHLLSREQDVEYAAVVLAAWASRTLPSASAG